MTRTTHQFWRECVIGIDVARKMGGKHARADHLRDSEATVPIGLGGCFWAPSSRSRDGAPGDRARTNAWALQNQTAPGGYVACPGLPRCCSDLPPRPRRNSFAGAGARKQYARSTLRQCGFGAFPRPQASAAYKQSSDSNLNRRLNNWSRVLTAQTCFGLRGGLAVSLPFVPRLSDSAIRLDVNMRIHLGSSPRAP